MHSDHTCACVPVAAALHVCPRVKTGTQVCACVCVPEHVSARVCAQWLDGVPAPGLTATSCLEPLRWDPPGLSPGAGVWGEACGGEHGASQPFITRLPR